MAYTPPAYNDTGVKLLGPYLAQTYNDTGATLGVTAIESMAAPLVFGVAMVSERIAPLELDLAVMAWALDQPFRVMLPVMSVSMAEPLSLDLATHQLASITLSLEMASYATAAPLRLVWPSLFYAHATPLELGWNNLKEVLSAPLAIDLAGGLGLSMAVPLDVITEHEHRLLSHSTPLVLALYDEIGQADPVYLPVFFAASPPPAITMPGEPAGKTQQVQQISGPIKCSTTVLIDGVAAEAVSGVSVSWMRDQYAITGYITLTSRADFLRCQPDSEVEIRINQAEPLLLRIERGSWQRTEASTYTVPVRSRSAWLDDPYATAISASPAGDTVVIAADLAAGLLSRWRTVRASIAPGLFAVEKAAPLQALRQLAEAYGAVLVSELDGSLTIEPDYPQPTTAWDTITPAYVIHDAEAIWEDSQEGDYRPGHNCYHLDNGSGGDMASLSISTDRQKDGSVRIRVTPNPWTDTVKLEHHGGPWVGLSSMGVVQRAETETVRMVGGEGNTSHPVYLLLSTRWQEQSLGLVSLQDGILRSSTRGNSLLAISYVTRAHEWMMTSPREEEVMFTAHSEDSAAAGSVAVLVRRGAGDLQGNDVHQPLASSTAALAELGRVYCDRSAGQRTTYRCRMPFNGWMRHGHIVRVFNSEAGDVQGMLLGQNVVSSVGEDGSPEQSSEIVIEALP